MVKEVQKREERLRAELHRHFPELDEWIRDCEKRNATLAFHQDAFAVDYEETEYRLLGMLVKYCGILGIPVLISGKNGETLIDGWQGEQDTDVWEKSG